MQRLDKNIQQPDKEALRWTVQSKTYYSTKGQADSLWWDRNGSYCCCCHSPNILFSLYFVLNIKKKLSKIFVCQLEYKCIGKTHTFSY